MAAHNPPPRRYPVARSNTQVPSLHYPSEIITKDKNSAARRQYLVFFIPGNPGLADYYVPFLTALRQLLNETEAKTSCAFHIRTQNLIGFDDADHEPPFSNDAPPFSLEDQICHIYDSVFEANMISQAGNPRNGRTFDGVILMGHSVGAYIAMEIFHRHHLAQEKRGLNLKTGIMLFPTITHIAKSRNGWKMDWLRTTPFLDRHAHRIARRFLDLWPSWVLQGIIRPAMGFADHGTAATTRWITSRDGLWQTLHLGKDEMGTITEERWSEELWEIADEVDSPNASVDKFYFLFGQNDEWVGEKSRDEFIRRRKEHAQGRTRIVIDENKIPHAFCIHHSELVAQKIKPWIEEVAGA
ncbi:hypothetical protein B0H66DRAFT_530165 [Apodospora peruviana]|uniref:Lipid droplet-associated hydrolase n=1 Tax=Apodospora peruviana TaxID=516989 RepID=A0AAE0IJX6_9PEZI|nr:hypothetical protein B0H66DRAFT_530165 [Apodospora peruviana]